ncbi:mucin-17-like isoform X2 [Haliotis rubra]|uniref:mucin-17-like isoform X2 n=1 Tax=Haliotis rubra TaxID=36100 RepID=UPI001EE5AD4C|nr:mucin-17-like isoform X2 [Haliotis rubra]XP_046546261.1 mucin-17-like isoform X2 [Haliotis rubra]
MELKLVCVLLLAFTLSAEAGTTTEGSSATPSIEGSSPATSTTEGSSAPPSAEGSSPATSTTEDTSATPSTTEDTSATPSTTEDTSTTPSTTEDTSTTTSTTEDTSATTSTIVGSSATPIKTGVSKSTETAQFKIELMVKVNASFDDLLQNASSELYKNHASEFKEKMMPVYENIPGFLYVEVTGFSEGSIIVHHKVIIKPDAENGKEDLYRIIQTKMNILTIFNRPVELNDIGFKSLLDTIKDNCKAGGICLKGFTCKNGNTSSTTCQSPCTPVDCHRGTCYVNTDGKPTCKCNSSDDVVYGGDKCDVQGTRMSMGTGGHRWHSWWSGGRSDPAALHCPRLHVLFKKKGGRILRRIWQTKTK